VGTVSDTDGPANPFDLPEEPKAEQEGVENKDHTGGPAGRPRSEKLGLPTGFPDRSGEEENISVPPERAKPFGEPSEADKAPGSARPKEGAGEHDDAGAGSSVGGSAGTSRAEVAPAEFSGLPVEGQRDRSSQGLGAPRRSLGSAPELAGAGQAANGVRPGPWWASWGSKKAPQSSAPCAPAGDQPERSNGSPPPALAAAEGGKKQAASAWSLTGLWRDKPSLPTLPAPVNLSPDRCRLAVTIAVNGWVQAEEDFVQPWNVLDDSDCERYAVVWERKRLVNLGSALSTFVGTKVADQTAKWFIQHFWFSGLLAAINIPSLIVTSSAVIDNAWSVALQRAESAGRVLANVLMARAHGDRPVKLFGFSMGARLIFHCLLELYRHDCRGIVEEVVLLGTPVSIRENRWAMARSVVASRFVNGFSKRDWVLGVVYRTANAFTKRCGGLCAVPVPGIENANLSSIISGHTDYMSKLPEILDALNLT